MKLYELNNWFQISQITMLIWELLVLMGEHLVEGLMIVFSAHVVLNCPFALVLCESISKWHRLTLVKESIVIQLRAVNEPSRGLACSSSVLLNSY